MRFFRRIAGILGFANVHDHDANKHEADDDQPEGQPRTTPTGPHRRGSAVPAQAVHLDPVITPYASGDGGVQGLSWFAKCLRIDEDGDVADEFLDEVSSESSALAVDHHKRAARFIPKYNTRPAEVKNQILLEGKLMLNASANGSGYNKGPNTNVYN